jgi:ABC-type lipoprotein release transport system permease subunit
MPISRERRFTTYDITPKTPVGGRLLESLLFETSRVDPLVLGSAAAVMLAVAIVATLLPARAASRANPASLLRL